MTFFNNNNLPSSFPQWQTWSCTVDHGRDAHGNPLPCPDRPQVVVSEAVELKAYRDPWPIAATILGLLNTALFVWLVLR